MRAKFINETKGAYEPKDLKRIKDFSLKSGGDFNKEIMFANRMASTLTNMNKAIGRAFAAYDVYGEWNEIVDAFYNKAVELGYEGPKPGGEDEPILGSQLPKGKQYRSPKGNRNFGTGRRGRFSGNPVLPIGKVDLITGECKYFNVYDTWDGIIEVWRDNKGIDTSNFKDFDDSRASSVSGISQYLKPKSKEEIDKAKRHFFNYKLVFTAGNTPIHQIGDKTNFYHDQNGSDIGYWEMVDYVPVKHMRELILPYGKKIFGYTYK